MIAWNEQYDLEIGDRARDSESRIDQEIAAQQLWVWDRGEIMSMALSREPVAGVVRISRVYTPPDRRKRGYAEACVHALSKQLREAQYQPILYTDLANATSNSVYRRIGYRAVSEALRYRFG